MANNITINVRAVVDKAISEVDQLKAKLNGLSTSEGFKSAVMGVGISAGMLAFNAIGASIAGVQNAIGQLAKSGMEEEASISRLGAALKANVPGWDGNTKAIEATFTAAQKLGFQDETLRDSFAVLVGATHDVAEAHRIQGIAMDLARYKHIDLQTASESLIKVEAGVYRSLKSLGIVLRDGATQAEAFAAVQAVASGQAQAFGDTTAGAMEEANVAIAEAYDSIGTKLLPVVKEIAFFARDVAVPAVMGFADAISTFAENSKREIDGVTAAWTALSTLTVEKAPTSGYVPPAPAFDLSPSSVYGSHLGPTLANMGLLGQAEKAAEELRQFDAEQTREQIRRLNEGWMTVGSAGAVASASAAAATQRAYEAQMQAGQSAIVTSVQKHMSDAISAELTAGAERANGIASTWSAGLGAQLSAGEPGWMAAINGLGKDMTAGLTKSAQAGYIMAALNSKMIKDGLASGKPGIAAETGAVVNTMLVTLDKMYGPAFLASYNFGSGVVNAAAKAIADGQMRAFGKASPGMAPIVSKAATAIPDFKNDPGYKSFMDAAQGISAAVGGGGNSSISTAATDAKAKLKQLADDAKTNLGGAFDKLKTSARTFFDDLHSRNLKAISDTRDLANAQLDAQIGAIDAAVQAARDALQATRDARTLTSLQGAVGSATDPAGVAAAQQALSDFQADQAIKAMEKDAKVKIDALTLQKKANDDAAAEQAKVEDTRYKAQTTAYDKEMAALQAYLDKHPAAWKATSDRVLKVLLDQGVNYAAAGAYLGSSFATGLAGDEKGVAKSAQAYGATSKAAGSGNVTINVNGAGDPAAVAEAILQALAREKTRQNMSLA